MHNFGVAPMESVQIILDDLAGTSKVTCPYCEKSKFIPNAQLRVLNHALRAKCTCNNVFELTVNRRCFPRKAVRFKGELFFQGTRESAAPIVVTSLSVGGLGFLVEGLPLQVGDVFTISFCLDDEVKTTVHEDIVVCNVQGHVAGAEFIEQGSYNADLDFYLMLFNPNIES
jgi:hypothetical protein